MTRDQSYVVFKTEIEKLLQESMWDVCVENLVCWHHTHAQFFLIPCNHHTIFLQSNIFLFFLCVHLYRCPECFTWVGKKRNPKRFKCIFF